MRNRREEKLPSWVGWVGNMSTPGNFIISKSWASPWIALKVANSFFRSLGVVAFACNPLTGMLIFAGMILGNYQVALGGFFGGLMAILFSKLLKVPDDEVSNGVSVFNSILVGSVMTAVLPTTLGTPIDARFCAILIVATMITVYVDQGLNAMMTPSKLPGQSVPFNLVSTFLFVIFKGLSQNEGLLLEEDTNLFLNESSNETLTIEWMKVAEGSILAAGQIYGVGTMASSICIWLGFLLYSPLLALMFLVGSSIGSLSAVLFGIESLPEIYSGLWGYNTLLASGGMAFFVVLTPNGFLSCFVNAIIAVMVHVALIPTLSQTNLPVLSYPFNVAIMLVLAIATRKKAPLIFVNYRSFPELHIYLHNKNQLDFPKDAESCDISLRSDDKC